ncbi:MAG TPA: peptide deformylase [Cytophagaceae bacterium]|jgi:peptide deformylase|nr:peptide deformylase [Cytophagaceae bacterium]
MIITNDEEALRVKCLDVSPDEVGELIALLESELDNSNRLGRVGIGLAAPQIGIAKNIAIVRLLKNGIYDLEVNLINAKIEKGYDQIIFRDEGCLSFPGRVENTMRYQEVYLSNNLIYPHKFIATGLMAVVCQHELDHLNGILLSDRALTKISTKKVGPNEQCPCNSGKKYKRCCGG